MKKIDEYTQIEEAIIKFALYVPNQNVEEIMHTLSLLVSDQVSIVDSGHDCVDIIPSRVNKGNAIQFLMDRYGIKKEEVMAFGDAGNDEDMLQLAQYGYVMENAKTSFQKKFLYIAPSNEEDGVLQVIEEYIQHETFLNKAHNNAM